jgi:BirA family biotin operon repressor/biotin-[acetyl-CoA-carboxylase] ligase
MSLVLRFPPPLLPLFAGVAVCDAIGAPAALKWPNDVVLAESGSGPIRKLAGILAEGRPAAGWAVLGIGLNVAVDVADLPPALRGRAASLGLAPDDVEGVLARVLSSLAHWLAGDAAAVLEAWRERDVLRGREISWAGGCGRAGGLDGEGRLLVVGEDGGRSALEAGEVHLVIGGADGAGEATVRP